MNQQASLKGFSYWRDRMREPALTVLLAAEVVAIFAVVPATGLPVYVLRSADAPLGFLFALIIVTAIARGRAALVLTFLASAMGITADLFRYEWPSALSTSIFLFAFLGCLLTLSGVVSHVVFGSGHVTAHRVRGAVVLYLHLALMFTIVQAIVLFFVPGAFGDTLDTTDTSVGGKLLYFSFTTLTTVGYGDIVPVHPYARSAANLEAIFGQLYPATLLARVVTLSVSSRNGC
jgi:hypothetical protein